MNARWWLCVPPLVAFTADVTATLIGQPTEYWAGDYSQANEGNPLARWLMETSPWLAVGAGAVYAVGFTLVVRYWRFGPIVAFLLTAGHTVGVGMWLIRLGWPGWVGVVAAYFVMERVWAWCRRLSPPPVEELRRHPGRLEGKSPLPDGSPRSPIRPPPNGER